MIEGTYDFYDRVRSVFEAAKRNPPAVVFIDDCDLLFEHSGGRGFYRYLLTMLDGLESASAERVFVIVTAMDVNSLPPALLRSGRIELWRETRLPDTAARSAILHERLSHLPPPLGEVDVAAITEACAARPAEEHILEAVETVRDTQRNYSRKRPFQSLESGG